MANTNLAALTSNQLQMWSRDFWRVARNMSFINQFAGTGSNAMVQRITELTASILLVFLNLLLSILIKSEGLGREW